jgi:hypothetical protein
MLAQNGTSASPSTSSVIGTKRYFEPFFFSSTLADYNRALSEETKTLELQGTQPNGN